LPLTPSNKNLACWVVVAAFVVLHLIYINTPFVNLEWAYRQGSLFFITGSEDSLADYLAYQANPLTFPYLSSWLAAITDPGAYFPYRLLALCGGVLLLISLLHYRSTALLLIVVLNPLIWIYSGRGYSELLSVGLMMLAFNPAMPALLRGGIGSLAGMVKYHAWPVILLHEGFIWLEKMRRTEFRGWRNTNLLAITVILISAGLFLSLYFLAIGIWIYPAHFSDEMSGFTLIAFLNNFFGYGFFLSGMFFLTLPIHFTKQAWQLKAGLFLVCLVCAYLNSNLGEMDFGSFELLLGEEIVLLIKAGGFWNFLLCCHYFWKEPRYRTKLLTVLFYVAVLSVTRPAQRYLIFIIPLWAILITQCLNLPRLIRYGYILCLVPLNLFATLYQVNNAQAASNMAEWITQNGMTADLGAIHPHIGNTAIHDRESSFAVRIGSAEEAGVLHSENIVIFGKSLRTYVLKPAD